jgi:hypothetical protein
LAFTSEHSWSEAVGAVVGGEKGPDVAVVFVEAADDEQAASATAETASPRAGHA